MKEVTRVSLGRSRKCWYWVKDDGMVYDTKTGAEGRIQHRGCRNVVEYNGLHFVVFDGRYECLEKNVSE